MSMSDYIETNGYFTFDGLKSSNYGVWVNSGQTFNAPKRRYKEYIVPGKNGTLTIDEGSFEEMEHTYEAFIKTSFSTNIETFRNALMSKNGYKRLTDSIHTNEFYLARYMSGINVDVAPGGVGGSFKLTFMRDPRRLLLTGEAQVTIANSGDTITNPTLFASNPLIYVTMDGLQDGRLTINGEDIYIFYRGPYLYIDSEIQDCNDGGTNLNDKVALSGNNFPVLNPGATAIYFQGGITSVKITPRWWVL